jgi:hypothetical protein
VWVRRFDGEGNLADTASGFVLSKNRIATAFQNVDAASRIEIEFASGLRVQTDDVVAYSRKGDWAVLAAPTGDIAPMRRGDPAATVVGARLMVFNVEGSAKAIGGVDISGKRSLPAFGERIQYSPGLTVDTAGGPLLDSTGGVIAILGGSIAPGTRLDAHHMNMMVPGLTPHMLNAATPISSIATPLAEKAEKLGDLVAAGAMAAPLAGMDGLIYVVTCREAPSQLLDPLPRAVAEFSRRDKNVAVLSEWVKKGKVGKGVLAARIYDGENHERIAVPPKKVTLSSTITRSTFGFAPAPLEPGLYRIDLIWDDRPVWRTFIRIVP